MSRPMFNPRGSFSSPRYPNQGGSSLPRGSFMGAMRMEGSRPRLGTEGPAFRGLPQGFTVSEAFTRLHALGLQTPGQDRSKMMDVQLPQHRGDPRLTKDQLDIPDLPLRMGMQESPPISRSERSPWSFAGTRPEHTPADFGSSRFEETSPRSQNRYNSESASSILASFGLSNEDLEELSHYPDDQLTPENMPVILREIRMRKLSRPEESSSGFSFVGKGAGDIVKGNVIDYGHASKYGYSEDPLERMLDSDLPSQDMEQPKYDRLPETSVSSMRGSRAFPSEICNEPPLQSVTQSPFPSSRREEKVNPVSEESVQPGLPIEALVSSVGDSRSKNKPSGKNGPVRNLKKIEKYAFGVQSPQNFGSQAPPPNFGNQAALPFGNQPPATFSNPPPATFSSSAPPMFGNQAAGAAVTQPAFPVGQGPWKPPPVAPSDVKLAKRLPTPSMMNDYYATTPRIYPHMCSLCNVECRHLKDWIEHQNTASHIESCRRLRQQYPDWNPEVLSSARKDVDAKAKEGAKARSTSPKRRRSRSHSTSGSRAPHTRSRSPHHLDSRRQSHRRIRSRSRSPRSTGALRRSRSRSPRISVYRRSRSPRSSGVHHRSRSPRNAIGRRSRSPRGSGAQRRSRSPRGSGAQHRSWSPRGSGAQRRSKSPRGLGAQHKPSAKHDSQSRKSPSPGKIIPSQDPGSKTTEPNKTSGKGIKPMQSNKVQPVIGKIPRADFRGKGASSQSSKLELEESNKPGLDAVETPITETDKAKIPEADKLKKPETDKTKKNDSDRMKKTESLKAKKPQPVLKQTSAPKVPTQAGVSKPSTAATPSSWEVLKPAEQFLKDRWMDGTIIHITELPDSGYTDQDILKLTMPFGKANDILIVRSKNEAFLEMAYKEAAEAVVDFSKTTPLMIGGKQVAVCIAGQDRSLERELGRKTRESSQRGPAAKFGGPALAGKPAEPKVTTAAVTKHSTLGKTSGVPKPAGQNITESTKEKFPAAKAKPKDVRKTVEKKAKREGEDATCCLLVTELPADGYTEEDLYRMAAPFGSVHDLIILATERKAYMELTSVKAADAMLNFYSFLPVTLHGSQLKLKKLPEDFDIADMEAVFTDAVGFADFEREADYYGKLVIVNNLPEEYTELEVLCLGLRFGNVQKYVFMKNKKRAVLKLNKPGAAAAMCKFFKVYPYSLRDSVLSFSLSPKLAALEGKDEDAKVPVAESTDKTSTTESASDIAKTVAPSSNTTEASTKKLVTSSSQSKTTATLPSPGASKATLSTGKPKLAGKPKDAHGCASVSEKSSIPSSKSSGAAPAATVKSSSASPSPVKPNLSPSIATKEKAASGPATKPSSALVSPTTTIPVAKPKSEPITFSFVVPEDKLKAALESSTLSGEEAKPTSCSVSSGQSKDAVVYSTTCTEEPKLVTDAATSEAPMEKSDKESQSKTDTIPSTVDEGHPATIDNIETTAGAASKIALCQADAPAAKGLPQKYESTPAKSDGKSKFATKQDTRKEGDAGKHLPTDSKQSSHTSSSRHILDSSKDKSSHSTTRSGSRRGHSPYEKDKRLEHKDTYRHCRERERSSGGRRDDDRSKHSSGRSSRTSKSSSSKSHRALQKVEEITFSFNLDDYVTVDEVGDEMEESCIQSHVVDVAEKSDSASFTEDSLVQPGVKNEEGGASKDSADHKNDVKTSSDILPLLDSRLAKEALHPGAHTSKDTDVLPCTSGITKPPLHPCSSEETNKDASEGLCASSSLSEESASQSENLTQKRSDLPEDLPSVPSGIAEQSSIKSDTLQVQLDALKEGSKTSSGGVPLPLPHEKSHSVSDDKTTCASDPAVSTLQSNAQKTGVAKAGQPCTTPGVKKESLLQHETPKGKRKVTPTKDLNSDPRSKKKKSADTVVDDVSFVTLDEIGEEEDSSISNETAVLGTHNEHSLVTVDEIGPDEDNSETVKDPHVQVEAGNSSSVAQLPVSTDFEKSEKMVEDYKVCSEDVPSKTESISACKVTSPLITFDETQGDKKDQPVGTSDENTEDDDDDACTFFNSLKGDMNFVTVDEIGGDDEDQTAELETSAVGESHLKEDSSNTMEMAAETSIKPRGKKRKQSPGEVQTRSKKVAVEAGGEQQAGKAESQVCLQATPDSVPQTADKEKK